MKLQKTRIWQFYKIVMLFIFILYCALPLDATPVDAARGVIKRRIPAINERVELKLLKHSLNNNTDIYEIEAQNGKLLVRGTSAVALCRGVYDYLKEKCGCLLTWEGEQLNIPTLLPDIKRKRVMAKVPIRQAFNVVTFGYTTAFWDWKRWEYEIDWMALHGINMPLAMTGQEIIWQKVWKHHFGLTDIELDDFFTGPAFLPWNRMGNIYGNDDEVLNMLGRSKSGRTLPQSFINSDAAMQKLILERETELGMNPVIPSFSGFIPRALKQHYPKLLTWEPTRWNSACRPSLALNALDPLFGTITKAFMDEYKSYYGDKSHFYLVDLFNEIDPPSEITRNDLSAIAGNVYKTLLENDSKAVWVTQGWCFFYQEYWKDKENTKAYLKDVPDDGMIILDLNADASEVFRTHPTSVARKKIVWSLLNDNWGQHTPLHGNLDIISSMPVKAMQDLGERMVGIGNSSEGIDNNSVCFEMLYDEAWTDSPIDLKHWLADYARQRYATNDNIAVDIWNDIYMLYYRNNSDAQTLPYQAIPNRSVAKRVAIDERERNLIFKMLNAPSIIKANPLFQRDLVDVVKNFVGNQLQNSIWKICDATERHDPQLPSYREEFNSITTNLDALLHTQKSYRLSTWTEAARKYASQEDADYMATNARLQVTTWVAPAWQGYARKEWSGLLSDFYAKKWNLFFDAIAKPNFIQQKFENEIFNWSNKWCKEDTLSKPIDVDVFNSVKILMKLIDNL